MIAAAIFFLAMFAILGVMSTGLHAATLLQRNYPTASMAVAKLTLTNKLEEVPANRRFRRDLPRLPISALLPIELLTNGLFQVDVTVYHQDRVFSTHEHPPLQAGFDRRSSEARYETAGPPHGPRAFTLMEIMVAVTLFMMVMISIMACWKVIIRGTQTGETAAAMAQRARTSMRAVEDSLNNLEISTSPTSATIPSSPTPPIPSSPPSVSPPACRSPSSARIILATRSCAGSLSTWKKDADDKLNLVMTQYPLLAIPNDQYPPKIHRPGARCERLCLGILVAQGGRLAGRFPQNQ